MEYIIYIDSCTLIIFFFNDVTWLTLKFFLCYGTLSLLLLPSCTLMLLLFLYMADLPLALNLRVSLESNSKTNTASRIPLPYSPKMAADQTPPSTSIIDQDLLSEILKTHDPNETRQVDLSHLVKVIRSILQNAATDAASRV